jgi:hypothetical protein
MLDFAFNVCYMYCQPRLFCADISVARNWTPLSCPVRPSPHRQVCAIYITNLMLIKKSPENPLFWFISLLLNTRSRNVRQSGSDPKPFFRTVCFMCQTFSTRTGCTDSSFLMLNMQRWGNCTWNSTFAKHEKIKNLRVLLELIRSSHVTFGQ